MEKKETPHTIHSNFRIEREKRTVERMIRLYCRRKEGNGVLCDRCRVLLDYARNRLEHCPFGEEKTSCRRCTVHCYNPPMREAVKEVMRFSGPRMPVYDPGAALAHWFGKLRKK